MPTPRLLRQSPAWPSVVVLCLMLVAGRARAARAQLGKVKVEIEGLSGELADNVHAVLQIEREGKQRLSPGRVQRLNGKADADINAALEPFGYYHARISKSLRRNGDNWIARYRIDPGPVVRVRDVDI